MRRAPAVLMTGLFLVGTLHPRAASAAPAGIDPFVLKAPGRTSALVHVATGSSVDAVLGAAESAGLDLGSSYDAIGVFVAYGVPAEFEELATRRGVAYIEGNRPVTLLTDSSHIATRGQELLNGDLTLPDGTIIDGSGIGVAIVDSGVDGTHPDLADRLGSNVKLVCATHPTSVYVQPLTRPDECPAPQLKVTVPMEDTDTPSAGGHGTHVAGIVAGTGAASGGRWHGAAPGVTLYGVSMGTAVTVENAVDGLRWVLENHDSVDPPIKVVNNSWGTQTHARYNEDPNSFNSATWKMQEALIEAGVSVVQAAGNTGGDGSAATTTPECVNPTPGIICVANYYDRDAGSRTANIDGSSSRGRADPSFVDTWPDVSAPGTNIISTCREHLPVCMIGTPVEEPEDRYAAMTGTSMAAPHVAGIVAQIYQVDPTLTPAEMEDLIEDSALKFAWGQRYELVDPTNPDDSTSFEKGHGLVDVVAAVRRLLFPDEEIEPDAEWPPDPEPPSLPPPGPPQRFYFHSATKSNDLDDQADLNRFDIQAPVLGGGAVAAEDWFQATGADPHWTGMVDGPIQSLKADFWVKSTDESTHDVGVPPIFQVTLVVGSGDQADSYRLPAFSPKTSAIDSVPRRITQDFAHYLVPDGPDEDTSEDLAPLNIDTGDSPVTISIAAGWFHHAGTIVFDSPEFPSGFSVNAVPPAQCAVDDPAAAPASKLFMRSPLRQGNLDAALGFTTLDTAAPTSADDARIDDVPLLRNPIREAALDPIWRHGSVEGTICSLTIDVWQKQPLDELILGQTHYLLTLWIDDKAFALPPIQGVGSATSDVTRITHTFTTMLDRDGNEVPLYIDASGANVAFEMAGRYFDADLQTSIFYDSTVHPSAILINGAL